MGENRIPFIDLAAQYKTLEAELNGAVIGVMRRCQFFFGRETEAFEQEFADYCGTKYAVGCGSGTAALELVLRASGIGPGYKVAVPAFTFTATAEAVCAVGAEPVFVDVRSDTGLLAYSDLRWSRIDAVIPVHLYGQMLNALSLADLCSQTLVIEDAAQAHGARRFSRKPGQGTAAACFSFYLSLIHI